MPLQHLEMLICAHVIAHTQTHISESSTHEGPGLCNLETSHGIIHLNMALLSSIKPKLK